MFLLQHIPTMYSTIFAHVASDCGPHATLMLPREPALFRNRVQLVLLTSTWYMDGIEYYIYHGSAPITTTAIQVARAFTDLLSFDGGPCVIAKNRADIVSAPHKHAWITLIRI